MHEAYPMASTSSPPTLTRGELTSGALARSGDGALAEPFPNQDQTEQGWIRPQDATFKLVNRVAHKGLWPGSPIRKEQAVADALGMHYSVQIQDADGHWHLASSKGRLLSPDYLLVNNHELKTMAEEVARATGFTWQPQREFFDGTRYLYSLTTSDLVADVVPGDTISLGILAKQSYDGTQRAAVEMYAERLVCANGMRVKDGLFSFAFEHRRLEGEHTESWRAELARASYQLRHVGVRFEQFVQRLRMLRAVAVGHEEMHRFTGALPKSFPVTTYGEIVRRFYAHEEPTAFGLLNACTWVTWHRGAKATMEDYRRNEQLVALMTGLVGQSERGSYE
ncbi:MAG: hypothetical protein RhofKO_17300 [Rhodothermales bacterium]